MSYEVPALPQEPKKPRIMAGREAKDAYQKKFDVYNMVLESHKKLVSLRGGMEQVRGGINILKPQDCSTLERDANGLYTITCPYCLEKFSVGDLQFRATTREDATGKLVDCFEPETDDAYADFWTKMGVNDIDSLRGHVLDMDPASGEIASITFETNALGGLETVPYDAGTRERMKTQKVLQMEDKYHNTVKERICPHCHTQLPVDIGFCPNYIYSFMGNSSCGKTIYLNRLTLTLTTSQFLNGEIYGIGANDEMAVFGKSARDSAKAIFAIRDQALADATDVGYIRPVILRLENTETHQKYFITLFDYPGEAIWRDNDAFFQPLADRVRKNSNGLLFVFDSGVTLNQQLSDKYKVVPPAGEFDEEGQASASAEQVLNRIYTHTFQGNKVNKPVALIMSKSDLIDVCMDKLTGVIWPERPGFLTPSRPHTKVMLSELFKCHKEVQAFLDAKEPGATSTAKAMCNGNHAWFAVSSTGIPTEDGRIPVGAVVSGLREADPLEWLLYRNGHLTADFGQDRDTAEKARRWAAGFQVEAYDNLLNLEKAWNGDPATDVEGEINTFTRLVNTYNSL